MLKNQQDKQVSRRLSKALAFGLLLAMHTAPLAKSAHSMALAQSQAKFTLQLSEKMQANGKIETTIRNAVSSSLASFGYSEDLPVHVSVEAEFNEKALIDAKEQHNSTEQKRVRTERQELRDLQLQALNKVREEASKARKIAAEELRQEQEKAFQTPVPSASESLLSGNSSAEKTKSNGPDKEEFEEVIKLWKLNLDLKADGPIEALSNSSSSDSNKTAEVEANKAQASALSKKQILENAPSLIISGLSSVQPKEFKYDLRDFIQSLTVYVSSPAKLSAEEETRMRESLGNLFSTVGVDFSNKETLKYSQVFQQKTPSGKGRFTEIMENLPGWAYVLATLILAFGAILLIAAFALLKGLLTIGKSMVESQKHASDTLKTIQSNEMRAKAAAERKKSGSGHKKAQAETFVWTPEIERLQDSIVKIATQKTTVFADSLESLAWHNSQGTEVLSLLQFGGEKLSDTLSSTPSHCVQANLLKASASGFSGSMAEGAQVARDLLEEVLARAVFLRSRAWNEQLHRELLHHSEAELQACFDKVDSSLKGVLLLHITTALTDVFVAKLPVELGHEVAESWAAARTMSEKDLQTASDKIMQSVLKIPTQNSQTQFLLNWASHCERSFASEQKVLLPFADLPQSQLSELAESRVFLNAVSFFSAELLQSAIAELPSVERGAALLALSEERRKSVVELYPSTSPIRLALTAQLSKLTSENNTSNAELEKVTGVLAELLEDLGPTAHPENWSEVSGKALSEALKVVVSNSSETGEERKSA